MPFSYDPTYVTWVEFKDETVITALATITEDAFDKLAKRAEFMIDAYVGRQERYDPEQARIFPRSEDVDSSGVPIIPEMVKTAAIRTIENIYLKTSPTTGSKAGDALSSESIGDYSYQKSDALVEKSGANIGYDMVPAEARAYLIDYRRKSVQISPPTGRGDLNLNSRQRFARDNY